MTSRTERFERIANATSAPAPAEDEEVLRFSPEEEANLLHESAELKRLANNSFAAGEYPAALSIYHTALGTCPQYLHLERAVLQSNVAACHLQTAAWKEAAKAAGECLDLLDRAEGKKRKKEQKKSSSDAGETAADVNGEKASVRQEEEEEEEEVEEEIVSAGAARAEASSVSAERKREIARLRVKALLRRGKARVGVGSWSALTGAEEDYKLLSTMADVTATDKKVVHRALVELPPKVKAAQEREMGEMMGKLKELGNGILKPFGLSTDNFNMVKDDKTGGYSLNFNQGGK